MERFGLIVQLLWLASPVLQLGLAAAMLRRRLERDFPFFFAYTIFRATSALLMFLLFYRYFFIENFYGFMNWFHELGCIALRFAVIYELFRVVLKPYTLLRDRIGSLFRWTTAVLLALAVIVAVIHRWGPYTFRLGAGLNLVDRTVDIVQCGLLVALLGFSRYLRLSWRNYAFGISAGMGVFAAVDLAGSAILLEGERFQFRNNCQSILQSQSSVWRLIYSLW